MVTLIEFIISDPALLATLCTIAGGLLLKYFEKWLSKSGERRMDKQDARAEIKELNERVDALEEEIRTWRSRYYQEQEEVALLRTHMIEQGMVPPARINPVI